MEAVAISTDRLPLDVCLFAIGGMFFLKVTDQQIDFFYKGSSFYNHVLLCDCLFTDLL
jgi:hypothetical protein